MEKPEPFKIMKRILNAIKTWGSSSMETLRTQAKGIFNGSNNFSVVYETYQF